MSTILLIDDSTGILADTAKKLEQAGYKYDYVNDYKVAFNFLRLSRPSVQIVIVSLNNSLGYPMMRKVHSLMSDRATIIIYSKDKDGAISNWVNKQQFPFYFKHDEQADEMFNSIKRSLFSKGQFFTHQQLLKLARVLSKYTNQAQQLVKDAAPGSKSLQELEHKLARKLDGIDKQRQFLSDLQK